MKCQPKAVVYARHVVKRPSKRMRASKNNWIIIRDKVCLLWLTNNKLF